MFTPVPGSPFADALAPKAVAYSASGDLLAVANTEGINGSDGSVSVYSVAPDGSLTQAPGSPVATGGQPEAMAFSSLGVLAVSTDSELDTYTVGDNGGLTPAPGSPISNGGGFFSVAFSPDGHTLALDGAAGSISVQTYSVAANGTLTNPGLLSVPNTPPRLVAFSRSGLLAVASTNEVSVFTVRADGSAALAPGSPYAIGGEVATAMAFGPGGQLAVTNEDNTVSTFAAAANGSLTPAPGSPYATGNGPTSVALDATGDMAVTNGRDNTVSLFSIAANGALTQQPGSPYATGQYPTSAAFSPNGLLAVANTNDGTVSEFTSPPPRTDVVFHFSQSDPTLEPDGHTFTETMMVQNNGASPTTSPSVMQLYVPANSGLNVISIPRGGQRSGQTITWPIPALSPGQAVSQTVTFRVAPTASGMVQLSGSTPVPLNDANPGNNTAILPITLGSGG